MKKNLTAIQYKQLLLAELKKKFPRFLLGFGAIVFSLTVAIYFTVRYFYLPARMNVAKTTPKKPAAANILKYLVKSGDTLAIISQNTYGSIDYADQIAKANSLPDPNVIEVGSILIIPSIAPKLKETGQIATGAATGRVTFKGDKYLVQEGDLLYDIAVKVYGDGDLWPRIAKTNNLSDPNSIHPGNELVIPRN
ncbi:LysM peptidoglycan-binding domain-containing protein [Candidatus Roizmanbacteria bacterium]|nr:LysM peptidoglycan-binding domain-containing protein [Candidatus Roizmanbacteria bacterium]